MDPRSSYFHHTKYANPPSPSPTLPPPPPLYPNSLNFHHHINFLAPPPPPPQQQPRPPQTPQFSTRNLQFSYNHSPNHPQTHDNYHRQLSHHDLPHFTQLPRVSHQFNNERQPPRRLPEFDHRAHEPRPDFRVLRNDQQTRHELEGNPNPNSRLVQDRNILIERESEHYHIRGGFGSNSDRSYAGDFRTVSNQVRGFESNSGNYENRRRLNYDYHEKGSENQRWFRDREVMIEQRDSSTEFGSNEIGDGETRIATGKREHYRSREGNLEVERHGSKRSREGSYEFNRTPRKQVQKKSALLRLQQPNYRNREDERVPYSGYVDDTKSSSFRGKDQESGFFRGKDKVIHTDCEMGEGEREGSPVELDVSFKSNSLVAKAILTPSSSSVGAFETILTPRNSKVRKVLVLAEDKDSNNSSMNKPNKVAVEVGKGVSVASKASSSDKDLKKSKEGVIASGINVRDSSSLPLKNRVEMPMKRTVSVRIGSSGKTSPLSGKKKKVVKRVVKKGVSHSSTLSSSQPTKNRDEPVNADSSAHSPAEPLDIDKAATVADVVDSQPCPIEATVIPENDRVERFEKFMESGQAGSGADSCNSSGKKNCSRSPPGSSNHKKTKFGESFVNGDCAKGLHAISNIDNSLTKPLDDIISSDIGGVEDFSKQPCQNGDSCSLENNAVRGSLKVMNSIEGNTDFGLLSLEKTIIHEDPPNSCIPMMGLDVSSINSQQRIKVSDKGTSDVGGNEPCRNQGSPLAESGITDLLQGPSFPVGSNEIFSVSISGETGNQNAVIHLNQGAGTILGSPNSFTNLEEINISGHGTGDGIGEELYQDGVAKTLNSVPIRGSLNAKVSTGGSEEDANEITKNDKKIEMPQLDLSRTDVHMHLEPANMDTSTTAHWVDTTLRLCFEDDATDQCTFSGAQFVDAGSQSCSNVVSALHEGSLTDVSAAKVSVRSSADVGQSGVSRWNEKNRKSSVPQLELCSPVESDGDEGPVFAGNSTSGMEVPSNSCSSPTLPKGEVVASDMDSLCSSDLLLAQKGITALLENGSAGEHFSPVASIEDVFEVDGLKDVQSHLTVEDLAVKKVSSRGLFVSGVKDIINSTPVVIGGRNQNDSMDIDAVEGAKVDINVAEAQVGIESVSDHCQIPSKPQPRYLDQILPSIDVDDGGFHGAKNDSPCMSNNPSSFGDGFGVSSTNSGDERMEIVPETLSDRDSPESLPDVMVTSLSKNSVEKIHENDDKIPVERAVINVSSNSSTSVSSSQKAKVVLNLDHTVERDQLLTGKTGHLPSQDSKITSQMPFIKNGELYGKKNHDSHAVSKIYSGRSSFVFTASKSSASSSRISKTRTWHRTDNCSDSAPPANKAFLSTVPALRQFPRKADRSQRTSYIRKGNSLVRKPTSVAQSQGLHGLSSSVYQLNSSGIDEPKKSAGSDSRIDLADPLNAVRTGGMDASFEKPRTPSLPSVSKISNQASNSLGGRASSPLAEHLHSLCTETVTVPAKLLESNDIPKSSDEVLKISESPIIQNSQISNIECHSDLNDVNNMVLANGKSLTYVKRKSNQLVAASNPCASSAQNTHNTSSSDSYYKRRKNQLIRTSLESQVKQTASILDESLNSEGQTALNSFSRNFSKRRLRKVVTKTCKPSKLSLVWTLHGAQLSKNDGDSLRCGKVLPHLFPWKRATYRRSSLPYSSSISDHSSLSTIGRKLLLLRKRNTVYTRSKHGFSLRKSKVLSVGGSSLKWSKSIEKHSKKANEEATLAVAAAERKRREQRGAVSAACPTKSRNSSRELTQRERIFRIGSVRYKMDSSRRTLQRISDDESSSGALQKEKDAKKMYIPRRLMIGKDEYVRIGNGNQLIRDPKKRTRILASEKVRWSLHTARSRLARKRKYCQFFTRFGKCNKDDGKCPFIHDSSKIAVCTKFLNGLCFNPDCKLTHKVIPERMPDCSYFLQGLCTNKNCPYRHVHVNPNASTCEGFLRGYCADGNECPKKHSYVCPTFEATGSCPQGSKCKLHHPKNRTKEKKCKRSHENNAHGRYFGLMHINATKMRKSVPGKLYVQDNDTICLGTADYISLDVSDEETVENNNPSDMHTAFGDSDPLNLQLGDLDEVIKPVRIMNI